MESCSLKCFFIYSDTTSLFLALIYPKLQTILERTYAFSGKNVGHEAYSYSQHYLKHYRHFESPYLDNRFRYRNETKVNSRIWFLGLVFFEQILMVKFSIFFLYFLHEKFVIKIIYCFDLIWIYNRMFYIHLRNYLMYSKNFQIRFFQKLISKLKNFLLFILSIFTFIISYPLFIRIQSEIRQYHLNLNTFQT